MKNATRVIELRVKEIVVYPIKGLGALLLSTAKFSRRGLAHDRAWTLTDASGNLLSAKGCPRLAEVEFSIEGDFVWACAPGMTKINLAALTASAWFSELLKISCRLTASGPDEFADHQPISLITTASLMALNGLLTTPFSRLRFRPNLIVEGNCQPYAETKWRSIDGRGIHLGDAGACVRPHMFVHSLPWARSLSKAQQAMRMSITTEQQNLIFGKYLRPIGEGTVKLEDKLCVA